MFAYPKAVKDKCLLPKFHRPCVWGVRLKHARGVSASPTWGVRVSKKLFSRVACQPSPPTRLLVPPDLGSLLMRMFAGFKSLCIISWRCRKS